MTDPTVFVDLDGTLTRTELLPAIATRVGIADEMGALTAATLAGDIPFEASFRKRVAMLAAVPAEVVHEEILAAPVFEQLLRLLVDHRDKVVVVTGNLDIWVRPFLERHGLRGLTSEAEVADGSILGVRTVLDKATAFERYPADFTIAIGDGANDAPMVAKAGIGIAWCGVHAAARPVLEVADYAFAEEEALCRFLRQWW